MKSLAIYKSGPNSFVTHTQKKNINELILSEDL
jgi:hypothetical protein